MVNWGLILLGTVVIAFESLLLVRGFTTGNMRIQAQLFSRVERPNLFWTGAALNLIWLVAGIWALVAELNL